MNPYRPGAGLQPPELTGRESELAYFDSLIARASRGLVDRGMVMSGLRGVGKTALLNAMALRADSAGWLGVSIEGQVTAQGATTLRRRFGAELQAGLARFRVRHRIGAGLERLAQIVGSFTVSVGPASLVRDLPEPGGTGLLDLDVESVVVEIATEALKRRTAFGIFIDEMQDLDGELLSALIVAQHKAQQRGLPFFLLGTGLPNLPARLTELRSYVERLFHYVLVGPLAAEPAADALVLPARRSGCRYEPEAVSHLVDRSRGYPYFLQEYGRAIWDLAVEPVFTLADAQAAVEVGTAQLDAGFFPARWERATPRERDYMSAMAEIDQFDPQTADIAATMGRTATDLSPVRQALLRKGLVYVPERGRIAFSVPGMADYIRRLEVTD